MTLAESALAQAPADAPHWLRASLQEGRARAAAAAGDTEAQKEHVALAQAELAAETDVEDRDAIAAQLADLSERRRSSGRARAGCAPRPAAGPGCA